MDDQKGRDSIVSVIKQSFLQLLEDPNLKAIKENEYSCNCILQRMTELFFDIFQSERQAQNQQLKAQYTMLKEYCQNLSHEKFEMQREMQNEILKLTEQVDKVESNNTLLNEEINMIKLRNEHFQIENKRIASEQEILLLQISEQRTTFQQNIEEMEMMANELKIDNDVQKERIRKLENANEKQLQQIREYSLSIQKQQNKIKETENQYIIESQTKSHHLNELETAQKNLRELELLLRQSNEENNRLDEDVRLNQNKTQELDKQIKSLEMQLNDKKREIAQMQKQQEQILLFNEENQKKFILNTVHKYKEKIAAYKKKLQEYKDKQDEQNQQLHELQLQDNEEKNGYQKQIQHIESQIQAVQTQYEGIITNIKQNSKLEQDGLKEGFEKDMQLKELQYKQEIKSLEIQMKDRIKNIEERTVSKELYEASKKDKSEEMEQLEKDKNVIISEMSVSIKSLNMQIEKYKEQVNQLNYQITQTEMSQNRCRQYEEEMQKLQVELRKKQESLQESKDRIKQSQFEIEGRERENLQLQEEIKSLEEVNQELQNKSKETEKKLNQQIKQLKDKFENQSSENYKLTIELREIKKEQEIEKKSNQEMLLLLEKRNQGINIELNEIQSLRSNNIVLQGKLENVNSKLSDTKETMEQFKKEKEYLTNLVEQQSKKLRSAEEIKIKFTVKIQQLVKQIQQIKGDYCNSLEKEFSERLSTVRKEYLSQIEDFSDRFFSIYCRHKEEEEQLTLGFNHLKQQFEELKIKYSKSLLNQNTVQEHSPKRIDKQRNERSVRGQNKKFKYDQNSKEQIEEIDDEEIVNCEGVYSNRVRNQDNNILNNQRKLGKVSSENYIKEELQYTDDEGQEGEEEYYRREIKNHKLRKSLSDQKGRFNRLRNQQDEEEYYQNEISMNKERSLKRNKSEERAKQDIVESLQKQIDLKKEKLLLEEYVMDDLKRIKLENIEMVEERMRLVSRIEALSNELSTKQIQADTLTQQINLLIREAGLSQQENALLKRRIGEAEQQLRKVEDIERINQELVSQDAQVREECKEQNKALIDQLQREIAEYRVKELESLQKIAQQEVDMEEKIAEMNKMQTLSQQDKANFQFKTRILVEQKDQAVQLYSQGQQITEYRDEIQTLLQENSQLLQQVQAFQVDIEGLHLALEKARIQIQIADQRESQLTISNQQLQQEVLSAHLKVQKMSNEYSQLQLAIANDKLKLKQKQNIKKEKQLLKEKLEQQNIKEIHQMIENSYISLKKKNTHAYKSSIQLTSNFAPSLSSANTSLTPNLFQQNISNNNTNLQYDQINSENQSLKLLNAGMSNSPNQNTFYTSFMKGSSLNPQYQQAGQILHSSSQQQLQNITNNVQNRSQKNLSLHTTNTIFQTPNHHHGNSNNNNNNNNNNITPSYSNLFVSQNPYTNPSYNLNSKDSSCMQFSNSVTKNISSPQSLISNSFVRNGFVKGNGANSNNSKNNNNEVENTSNTKMNTSNNQSSNHARGQSLHQGNSNNPKQHLPHQASTSSLLNNQYKYMSSNSTNVPINHTFNTSIYQNDFNQSTNKQLLLHSNSKSQSNLFASQNSVNNNYHAGMSTYNNSTNSNQNQVNNNLFYKNTIKADTVQDDKARVKSLSSNAGINYTSTCKELNIKQVGSGALENLLKQHSPAKVDNKFTQNLNLSREIENPSYHIKDEISNRQLDLKNAQEGQDFESFQNTRKLNEGTHIGGKSSNNNDNKNTKIERIQSENESILEKLNKLQQLDQYLQRSRSSSNNQQHTGSFSVKNAIQQTSIPTFQQNSLQGSGNSTPNVGSQLSKRSNNMNRFADEIESKGLQNFNLTTIDNNKKETHQLSQRGTFEDEIAFKQKLPGNKKTNEMYNIVTSPSQNFLKPQQALQQHKLYNPTKEIGVQRDDNSTFTPFSNKETLSFADHESDDIQGNPHRSNSNINNNNNNNNTDFINSKMIANNQNYTYSQNPTDIITNNNVQYLTSPNQFSTRRSQSFHNNYPKKI